MSSHRQSVAQDLVHSHPSHPGQNWLHWLSLGLFVGIHLYKDLEMDLIYKEGTLIVSTSLNFSEK